MIAPATLAHAAAMAAIHRACFAGPEQWGADAFAMQLALPGTFGLIASEGGLLIGRAAAGEAEVLTLAVVPAQRRKGLGRALLRGAAHEALGRGARALFLEVSSGNRPARALYSEAGFFEIGRRAKYYSGGTDALVLRLDISGAGMRPRAPGAARASSPCESTAG